MCRKPRLCVALRRSAELTRPTMEKACGVLPICRPVRVARRSEGG